LIDLLVKQIEPSTQLLLGIGGERMRREIELIVFFTLRARERVGEAWKKMGPDACFFVG
jgi:hypothetical protein